MVSTNASLLIGIISIFVITATFLPFITGAFDDESSTYQVQNYQSNVVDEGHELSNENFSVIDGLALFGDIFVNVFKLAFFGVSGLPWFIDVFFTLMAIAFVILLITFIPTVGG